MISVSWRSLVRCQGTTIHCPSRSNPHSLPSQCLIQLPHVWGQTFAGMAWHGMARYATPYHTLPHHTTLPHPDPPALPPRPLPLHCTPSHRIPLHPSPAHPIASHSIPTHPIASHCIPLQLTPSHRIPSHPIPLHPIASHCTPSHPIPSMAHDHIFNSAGSIHLMCSPHTTASANTHEGPLCKRENAERQEITPSPRQPRIRVVPTSGQCHTHCVGKRQKK